MDIRKGKMQRPFRYYTQTVKLMLLGFLLLSAIFLLTRLNISHYFPIKTVRIYGTNRVDHQEIRDLLLPLVKRNFFSVNVDMIRYRLSQLPWVSQAVVRRTWPDKVDITVLPKKPIAKWNNQSLLSHQGELFSPKRGTYPASLPKLIGPDGKHILMLQYFHSMNRLLTPLHARISHLEMTPYYSWKVTLDNGISLQIGHKDILTRLNHFVKVYPKIVGARSADVDSVDLRYPNGLAVRWRTTLTA